MLLLLSGFPVAMPQRSWEDFLVPSLVKMDARWRDAMLHCWKLRSDGWSIGSKLVVCRLSLLLAAMKVGVWGVPCGYHGP